MLIKDSKDPRSIQHFRHSSEAARSYGGIIEELTLTQKKTKPTPVCINPSSCCKEYKEEMHGSKAAGTTPIRNKEWNN